MLLFIAGLIFASFAFVVLIGAPYLPTLSKQQEKALGLLGLEPGQLLLDLGSGDGRLLLVAAKSGIRAYGIEANPFLVIISKIVCLKYRHLVTIKWGDMWRLEWPNADGIYVFLHSRFMARLDKEINKRQISDDVRVVSYAFKIPEKKPSLETEGMYLYEYKNLKNI